jgi:methylenetetrahydrofolate reductase (NADPH)
VVSDIHAAGAAVAPHLSCVGSSRESVRDMLKQYQALGVKRIVALRGDLPSGMGQYGEFHHANELVEFIRAETGDWFHIDVAAYPECHPQAKSPASDIHFFVEKMKAGANSAVTQYFYNSDAYFRFVDEAYDLGVTQPVVAGIMPITNSTQLLRFSDACGAEIPRWIRLRLQSYGDDTASIRAFGEEVVTDLCDQLLVTGAPGLHFYSLNQADAVLAIADNLGLNK